MAYPLDIHPSFPINGNLKREKDDHLLHPSADLFHPAGPPGPNLGADVVENRDIPTVSSLCQPEVEVRKVDEDDQVRPLPVQGLLQYLEGLEDRSDFGKDFGDPYDGEGSGGIEEFHPRPFESFSSHAKKLDLRIEAMDCLDEMSAVKVSGDFSCDHKNLLRFHPFIGFPILFFSRISWI
jgi:hypothetical protein